jgi:hypothetical protein
MTPPRQPQVSWRCMEEGIRQVQDRLERAARALEQAGIPYAIVGGSAVAAWVSTVEPAAVRNTRDVDLLLAREDFERALGALGAAGFLHRRVTALGRAGGMDVFLDGPHAPARDALQVLWAGEAAVPDALEPNPALGELPETNGFRLVPLEDLVRMKLVSFRDKDRMHLRDLISVGLVDDAWPARFPAVLADRLRQILADPEG